ncbi:hypothetical protein [Streptomyces boluensis]|uniref:Uncharacterized protein n=1 Tax=Streptomyces boluensis TaxID=1775135 RepID=A0A964URX1_9ACTN|nr:hypothetical protein [Streptomyces boluensis]NBE53315.1 hypothetical protein [Streptomyces boluensis]
MPAENDEQFESWKALKPGSAYAVKELRDVFEADDASPEELIDTYLFAKRSLARSMQALLLSQLPAECDEFREVCERIREEMVNRYADRIPERFLKVPYGSQAHELLFAILMRSVGKPVDSALLRVSTSDNVHTERRTRELRELGLSIATSEVDGNQFYTLVDLEVDSAVIPSLVAKVIGKSTALTSAHKRDLIAKLPE